MQGRVDKFLNVPCRSFSQIQELQAQQLIGRSAIAKFNWIIKYFTENCKQLNQDDQNNLEGEKHIYIPFFNKHFLRL